MFKKLMTLVLTVLILGLSLSGVSAQDKATVTFFTFSAAPDHLNDLDAIVKAFEEANPDVKVEVKTAAYADYFTLLQTDIGSGAAPDVFELNYENFVTYAANNTMLDLSGKVSADAPFYPAALKAFSYDGKQYALPETFSTVLLFYNADLFDKAGVSYPTEEWTWTDAMEAAKKIRALGTDTWGIYQPVQFWEFYKKAAQQGECQFFNADMTESTINSPGCVAALETMMSFMKEGVMPTAAELSGVSDTDLFASGKVGMIVTGIWMFSAFKDVPFKWDVQLEPGIAKKAHHFFANGVAVSATTKNADAAAKWAEFLTSSQKAAEVRVASSWELPALNKAEYFDAYLKQTPPANRAAVFKALETPVTPPVIVRQNEMQDGVNALITQVVDGELTAQQALDQAKAKLDELIKK
ncbi:MAG: sugar ABC transporter substrate-binding protein [Anaerolineae bacterium]|nr:sugar ABC transporter substrate-binding protein [Anaerolineae bacterium]